MPVGPRCFRCRMERLSEPVVLEFMVCFMASEVLTGLKEENEWSSWCSRCRRCNLLRSSVSWACAMTEVNCLVK